jgi:hypothetical protein
MRYMKALSNLIALIVLVMTCSMFISAVAGLFVGSAVFGFKTAYQWVQP